MDEQHTPDVSLVYYIGAGASANSLPTVENTLHRMSSLANGLDPEKLDLSDAQTRSLGDLREKMQDLVNRLRGGTSIDLLARQHYLRGETEDLNSLKATLSAFFVLMQAKDPVDRRYGYFFAYMADRDKRGTLVMPTNVRVISWNYDGQFEKSFAEFFKNHEQRRQVIRALQVVPPVTRAQHHGGFFSIYKLNGTAHIRIAGSGLPLQHHEAFIGDQPSPQTAARLVLDAYKECIEQKTEPYLQFSWENDRRREDVLALIKEFSPVATLVVIGYSFPVFNRDLDKQVLELLDPQQIFVQVNQQYPAVFDRLRGLLTKAEINEIRDVDQFYIPHRYSPSERRAPPN